MIVTPSSDISWGFFPTIRFIILVFSKDYKENTKNYFDLLYTSTKLRLNSDVKIGTSLSGGLDSSAIFALLNLLESNDEINKSKLDLNPIIMNYAGMKSKHEAVELSKMYNKINMKSLIFDDPQKNKYRK